MQDIFDVVQIGTASGRCLREVCLNVSEDEFKNGLPGYGKLGNILDKLFDTMVYYDAVGITAAHIGLKRCFFVVGYAGMRLEFINPEIVDQSGSVEGREGSVSDKKQYAIVSRPREILVKFQNRNGDKMELRAKGFLARIICHECDQLKGIFYTDNAKQIFDR